MSISLKTERLQRTQFMTGVDRRRIWRALRDIRYYKINTGKRGKNLKKKKKMSKMGLERLPKYNRYMHGRTITTMTTALFYFGF